MPNLLFIELYIYLHFDFSCHPLMDVEVRRLRVIHAIAEYGSTSKAAPSPAGKAGWTAGRPGRVASGPSRVCGRQASVMPLRARPPADSRTAAATAPATSAWNTLGMM